MQWDDSPNAGFAYSADPWLPVAADAGRVNVKFEKAIGNDQSVLKTFLNFTALRSESAFTYGQMTVIDEGKDLLFSFEQRFQPVVSPIPVFEKLNDNYAKGTETVP